MTRNANPCRRPWSAALVTIAILSAANARAQTPDVRTRGRHETGARAGPAEPAQDD
jgi:hypothetical protein